MKEFGENTTGAENTKEQAMPNDKAIESAAKVMAQGNSDHARRVFGVDNKPHAYDAYTPEAKQETQVIARAAIIAFLRNCDVSAGLLAKLLPNVDEPDISLRELAASACMELGIVEQNGIAAGAELARDLKSAFKQLAAELEGKLP